MFARDVETIVIVETDNLAAGVREKSNAKASTSLAQYFMTSLGNWDTLYGIGTVQNHDIIVQKYDEESETFVTVGTMAGAKKREVAFGVALPSKYFPCTTSM